MTDHYKSHASTHTDGCWAWDPKHYECAVRKIEALRAEVEVWKTSFEQAASGHAIYAERTEQLEKVLREWWLGHRPVSWTEDQHRACPHVNLTTAREKALADALLRAREA